MSAVTPREIMAKAIFEEPTASGAIRPGRHWKDLASHDREGWLRDADRVIFALVSSGYSLIRQKQNRQRSNGPCVLDLPDCPGKCGSYSCGD